MVSVAVWCESVDFRYQRHTKHAGKERERETVCVCEGGKKKGARERKRKEENKRK